MSETKKTRSTHRKVLSLKAKIAAVFAVVALSLAGGGVAASTANAASGPVIFVRGITNACGGDRATGFYWEGSNGDRGWTPVVGRNYAFTLFKAWGGREWLSTQTTCFRPWNQYVYRGVTVTADWWQNSYIAV